MVDLPKIPRRLVTTQAPRSLVSPADVAKPFTDFGQSLDNLGEAVGDVSVIAAEDQAQKAVTRGPDGELRVDMVPDFSGRAGRVHNRIAKQSFLIQLDNEARTKVAEKRIEFEGRPEAFRDWFTNYSEELAGRQTDTETENAVRLRVGQIGEQTHRGMLVDRHRLDMQRANAATNAKLLSLADDLEKLTRQGAPGEVVAATMQEFDALLDEKVNNPALAFPREKADRLRDEVLYRAHKGAILEGTERVYRTQGYMAAVRHLNASVDALGATVKDAAKIKREGGAWLRSEHSALRGERDSVTRDWAEAKKQFADLDPVTIDSLYDRAVTSGAWRVASDIAKERSALEIVKTIRALPREEQARIAASGKISIDDAKRGIGTIESSNRYDALGPVTRNGDRAYGKYQVMGSNIGPWTERWLGVRLTPQQFLNNSEAQEKVFEGQFGEYMRLYGPARAAAAWFAGPSGMNNLDARDMLGTSVQDYMNRFQAAAGGGGSINLTQSRAGLAALNDIKKELRKDLSDRIAAFESADRKLSLPSLDEITALGAEVAAVGTPDQKKRVAELAAQAQYGDQFSSLTPEKRGEAISAWNERLQAGGSEFERELRDKLVNADKKISEAYRSDPYGAHVRFGGGQALPAIDFANPQQAAAVIAEKLRQQDQIRSDQNLPAFPIFRPGEATAFRQAVTQGPPDRAAALVQQLANLPPEVLRETLADKEVRDALDGMVRSYDPTRLTSAMQVLDKVWRDDPVGFKGAFKDETLTRMQVWQTWRNAASPEEIVERFKRADDPAVAGARAKLRDAAADELEGFEAVEAFDTSFGITPGFIARNLTGSQPRPPADSIQAAQLQFQYETIYKEMRAYGADPDQAKEQTVQRLSVEWGASPTSGNRMMRFPPERHYPQIDGSHDWMRQQVEEAVAQTFGARIPREGEARDPTQVGVPQWDIKGLVSDAQTEAEIANGRKPSYQVVVTNRRTGRDEVLTMPDPDDPTQVVRRISFDPSDAQAAMEERFLDTRRFMQTPPITLSPF